MNRRTAAYLLARRHPDMEVLAKNMGIRADTLRKKLTGVEGYNWFVEEEEMLVELCQAAKVPDSLAPITAAAANAGALLVPLPESVSDGNVTFKCLADAAQEFGAFMSVTSEALADKKVSANELRDVETRLGMLVAKGQACLVNLTAIHNAGKPADRSEAQR